MQRRDLTDSECSSQATPGPPNSPLPRPLGKQIAPLPRPATLSRWPRGGGHFTAALQLAGNHSAGEPVRTRLHFPGVASKCFKLISPHGEIARHCLGPASGIRHQEAVNQGPAQRTPDSVSYRDLSHPCSIPVGAFLICLAVCSRRRLSASNLFMIKCLYWRQYQRHSRRSVVAAHKFPGHRKQPAKFPLCHMKDKFTDKKFVKSGLCVQANLSSRPAVAQSVLPLQRSDLAQKELRSGDGGRRSCCPTAAGEATLLLLSPAQSGNGRLRLRLGQDRAGPSFRQRHLSSCFISYSGDTFSIITICAAIRGCMKKREITKVALAGSGIRSPRNVAWLSLYIFSDRYILLVVV